MKFIIAVVFAASMPLWAELTYYGNGVIPHLADGGGVQTVITLVNLEDVSTIFTLRFRDDNGNALNIVTDAGTGASVSGALAPHASRTISTAGVSQIQIQGWAMIETSGTIGGSALYKISVAPWVGAEATLPVDTQPNHRFALSFDQRGSVYTGLALVNPSSVNAIDVLMTFKDESGAVFLIDSFKMGPLTHRSLVLNQTYPGTANKRGTLEVSTTDVWMDVLALRFSGASITSILPLVSWDW